jgi:hypothetical protein
MIKLLYLIPLFFFITCMSTNKQENLQTIKHGWIDEDTYTVTAVEINEIKAIEKAKYQILKDIVDVRVKNNSRYTDIVKIRDEFDIPLQNGKVISKQNVPDGVKIYFQIRDKGLKHKFEKR